MGLRQKKQITIYLDAETLSMLDALCNQMDIDRTLFFTYMVFKGMTIFSLNENNVNFKEEVFKTYTKLKSQLKVIANEVQNDDYLYKIRSKDLSKTLSKVTRQPLRGCEGKIVSKTTKPVKISHQNLFSLMNNILNSFAKNVLSIFLENEKDKKINLEEFASNYVQLLNNQKQKDNE